MPSLTYNFGALNPQTYLAPELCRKGDTDSRSVKWREVRNEFAPLAIVQLPKIWKHSMPIPVSGQCNLTKIIANLCRILYYSHGPPTLSGNLCSGPQFCQAPIQLEMGWGGKIDKKALGLSWAGHQKAKSISARGLYCFYEWVPFRSRWWKLYLYCSANVVS